MKVREATTKHRCKFKQHSTIFFTSIESNFIENKDAINLNTNIIFKHNV